MGNGCISQPDVGSESEDALEEGERPRLSWRGEIQHEGDSESAAFVVTDRRLLYRTDETAGNTVLQHISAIETDTDTDGGANGPGYWEMIGVTLIFLVVSALCLAVFSNVLVTAVSLVALVVAVLSFVLVVRRFDEQSDEEPVETTHHIRLARADEQPLHITTEANVATELRRFVADARES